MNSFSLEQTSANNCSSPSLDRDTFQKFLGLGNVIVACGQTIDLAFWLPNVCIFRFAQPSSRLHEGVQHHLQVKRRTADDLEDIGGGGLLLKRFTQLIEQPCVLDGDDGLSCEVLEQIDLLLGEGLHFLSVDENSTHQLILLEHRNGDNSAGTSKFEERSTRRIFVVGRLG